MSQPQPNNDLELSLKILRDVVADDSLPLAAKLAPAKLLAELKLKESAQEKNSPESRTSKREVRAAADMDALIGDAVKGNPLAIEIRNVAENYNALMARWRRLRREAGE